VRIFHAADFHLDARPPAFLGRDRAAQRREERLLAFNRIMAMARECEAELVLIAGDLFEDSHVRRQTVRRAAEEFRRLAPAWVLIAPGNHDPFTPEGFYRAYDWPENVHVFRPGWSQWPLPDGRCVVSGFGWDRPRITEPMLAQCPRAPSDCIHIVLLHGDVLAVNDDSPYLPVRSEDLAACEADYIALGHVHRAEPPAAGPLGQNWMNPGAPEPLDFGESANLRGVVLGTVGKGERDLRLEPVEPTREYRLCTVAVDGLDGEPAVAERVRRCLPPEHRRRDLVRVRLTGTLEPGVKLSTAELAGLLEGDFYFLELKDATRPAYDIEGLAQERGLRGEFVRLMRERIAAAAGESEREELREALELGLAALEGRDPNAALELGNDEESTQRGPR